MANNSTTTDRAQDLPENPDTGGSHKSNDQQTAPAFTDKTNTPDKQDVATAADWDDTVRQAEAQRNEAKPGHMPGGESSQHNNGRGGGK